MGAANSDGQAPSIREVIAELDAPFTLHFPVRLAHGRQIDSLTDEPRVFEVRGNAISVRRADDGLEFQVDGLLTRDDAMLWIRRIWRGLQVATVRCGLAFHAELDLRRTHVADDWRENPQQLNKLGGVAMAVGKDGIVDGSRPYLAPEGAALWAIRMGAGSVILGTNPAAFFDAVADGASAAPLVDHPIQLETALELFASADLEEQSGRARLLTYVMAIETLAAPARPKHPAAVRLLESWRVELDGVLAGESDDDARASLEALHNELDFRRVASMRSTVFRCINWLAKAAGLSVQDAQARRKRFDDIYHVRGALSHSGQAENEEIGRAMTHAKELCTEMLAWALEFGLEPAA